MEAPLHGDLRADPGAETARTVDLVPLLPARVVVPSRCRREEPHARPPDEIILQFGSEGVRGLVVHLDDPPDELKTESTQSISVGNHNF